LVLCVDLGLCNDFNWRGTIVSNKVRLSHWECIDFLTISFVLNTVLDIYTRHPIQSPINLRIWLPVRDE
jgi:hypothetical protein